MNQTFQKQFGELSVSAAQQNSSKLLGDVSKQVSNLSTAMNKQEAINVLQESNLIKLQNNISVQLQQQQNEWQELIQQMHQQQLYNFSQISQQLRKLESGNSKMIDISMLKKIEYDVKKK